MSDPLSPAERAAIAAFPETRVRRIPRGMSGEETWVWNEARNAIADPSGRRWTPWGPQKPAGRQGRPPGSRSSASKAMDARIAKLAAAGASTAQIARVVGLCHEAVRQRRKRMEQADG